MIETILVIGLVIVYTVWYMRHLLKQRVITKGHSAELEVLGQRYARGEIDRAEYLQKRSDILGFPLIS